MTPNLIYEIYRHFVPPGRQKFEHVLIFSWFEDIAHTCHAKETRACHTKETLGF